MTLLSDKQKAFAAFIIGVLSQSIAIITGVLTEGTTRTVIWVIGGIIGTIGAGLGVYQVTNKPI